MKRLQCGFHRSLSLSSQQSNSSFKRLLRDHTRTRTLNKLIIVQWRENIWVQMLLRLLISLMKVRTVIRWASLKIRMLVTLSRLCTVKGRSIRLMGILKLIIIMPRTMQVLLHFLSFFIVRAGNAWNTSTAAAAGEVSSAMRRETAAVRRFGTLLTAGRSEADLPASCSHQKQAKLKCSKPSLGKRTHAHSCQRTLQRTLHAASAHIASICKRSPASDIVCMLYWKHSHNENLGDSDRGECNHAMNADGCNCQHGRADHFNNRRPRFEDRKKAEGSRNFFFF